MTYNITILVTEVWSAKYKVQSAKYEQWYNIFCNICVIYEYDISKGGNGNGDGNSNGDGDGKVGVTCDGGS